MTDDFEAALLALGWRKARWADGSECARLWFPPSSDRDMATLDELRALYESGREQGRRESATAIDGPDETAQQWAERVAGMMGPRNED